ncbi:serine hydrolase domain-containing protein [Pseudonocardia sp. TRM90224]|uniref:serine hydrolase domain-containing protein n=1 Tax=Pseudonocardia sp. TRM90224 TaxID=2812678 RepID=UPI001E55F4EB|nr:serine hydrolase domain-containing protein [Pseudonocardia sp. TRM90224]
MHRRDPSTARWSRRRRIGPALVVGLVAAAAVVVGWPAAAAARTPAGTGPEPARGQLTELARKVVAAGAPGVIVRVDDGSGRPIEIVEQAPWAARHQRLRPDDEFRMGSNTKAMVATVALQLTAENKLSLSDPVEKWLPGQVPNGGAIMLKMLLNHTSGLFDYTQDAALRPSILGTERRTWRSSELLAIGAAGAPLFPPGTGWAYSNTDYAAIGAVLERATGTSLAELLRDRIVRPLDLRHTYLATDGEWRGRHAHGYEPDSAHMPEGVPVEFRTVAGEPLDGHVDVSANDPTWGGAAGAVVSTTHDWGRFFQALMSGQLLPPAQLKEMLTAVPQDPADPGGPGAGLGIMTSTTPCGTIWAHDGGITGYLSTNLTDRTGTRTASVLIPSELVSEFVVDPKVAEAGKALSSAVVCSMLGAQVSPR